MVISKTEKSRLYRQKLKERAQAGDFDAIAIIERRRKQALQYYYKNLEQSRERNRLKKRKKRLERRNKIAEYLAEHPGESLADARRALGFAASNWAENFDREFADKIFEPTNPNRPFLDPYYQKNLCEGFPGFNYAGETWARYYECWRAHRDGKRSLFCK